MRKTFFSLSEKLFDLINMTISIIIALAVIGFMWGIVKILFSSDSQVAKKEGRSYMLYGIFTLFVMTGIWGLVNLLSGVITPHTESGSNYNTGSSDVYNNGSNDVYNDASFDTFEQIDSY